MQNLIKTEFDELYEELNEIYLTDFEVDNGRDVFYHFYEDLSDLLNSLNVRSIYSTKNDETENKAQYDHSASQDEAYVCFTSTLSGKKQLIHHYDRPFGISFKKDDLINISNANGYRFDPESSFSAFGEKGNYTVSRLGRPQLLAQSKDYGSNPFSIYAIGELEPGKYFISGGQGIQHLWASQIFEDEALYLELKKWFLANMNSNNAYQRQMYYWFINGEIGEKTPDKVSGRTLLASGNLNHNYKPYIDKDGTTRGAIAFDFKGKYKDSFREVIGYGPINLENNAGESLLSLGYQWDNASGSYRGPFVFGKNLDTNMFNDKTELKTGQQRKDSIQQHLFADEQLFKKLCKIFDENETRVYIPTGRDMRFSVNNINTIVLPAVFKLSKFKETIYISKLIGHLYEGKNYNVAFNRGLIDALVADGSIEKPKRSEASNYLTELVKLLIKLLKGPYANVSVEIIPSAEDDYVHAKASLNAYLKDRGETDALHSQDDIHKGDHLRKVINDWPDLAQAKIVPGEHGERTVVAPVRLYKGQAENDFPQARIGAEVIFTARDADNKKYVLFVPKAKSTTFMELPGGGFMDIPAGPADFERLVYDRLSFKCGIERNDVVDLRDTGKALLLYEEDVAKSKEVTWKWSYYRLFFARLNRVLSEDELDYTYNNRELAKSMSTPERHVNGYKAYLRWIPLDGIDANRAITDRYANVINMIRYK